MAIFVMFRSGTPAKLDEALTRLYPDDNLEISKGVWLVSSPGTARQLSDKLGVSDGELGAAIIFSMGNYYGRASTEIWDWIKEKAEQNGG